MENSTSKQEDGHDKSKEDKFGKRTRNNYTIEEREFLTKHCSRLLSQHRTPREIASKLYFLAKTRLP